MKMFFLLLFTGHYKWKEGRVSGAVYKYDEKLINFITEVYGKASYTNPLHPDVFPGVCKITDEEASDHTQILRVAVDPKALAPAFPNLHLVDVDVKEREFLLKIGKIQ